MAKRSVAAIEEVDRRGAQRLGRPPRLLLALLRGAAGARLAAGEMQDAHPATLVRKTRHRAAAGELDIVGMAADGQNVELHASPPKGAISKTWRRRGSSSSSSK